MPTLKLPVPERKIVKPAKTANIVSIVLRRGVPVEYVKNNRTLLSLFNWFNIIRRFLADKPSFL
jgi:hypothetical protein